MMNCKTARRFLYAFADGELSVRDSCDVLEHLKMCPECSRIVADQQQLRTALRAELESVPVPATLADRVRRQIDPGRRRNAVRPRRLVNWVVPLAAAASIGLAVFTIWRTLLPFSGESAVLSEFVNRGSAAASMVVATHESCTGRPESHHHAELPRERTAVATAITEHFNGQFKALAPDFSPAGYRFESANYCSVRPNYPGGHVVYVGDDDSRLSFFSVPRWDCLDRGDPNRWLKESDCRAFSVQQKLNDYAVVAWHNDQTSYVCCAEMQVGDLVKIVQPVRLALESRASQYAALWTSARRAGRGR